MFRLSATDHMLWLQLRQGQWDVATLERWAASAASDPERSSSDMMQRNTRVSAVCRNKNATRVSATVCVRAAISRQKVALFSEEGSKGAQPQKWRMNAKQP